MSALGMSLNIAAAQKPGSLSAMSRAGAASAVSASGAAREQEPQSYVLGPYGDADALDFPFERNSARLEHPTLNLLAERFQIGAGGRSEIDEKVAMHGRHLSTAKA